jgi:hypothetical protein
MSNIVDRAAIMAAPPQTPTEQVGPSITPRNILNYVALGGIMWFGGKAASWAWDYIGLDKKPKRKKMWAPPEEPEAIEEEEPEAPSPFAAVEEENPGEDEDEPDEDEDEPDEDEPDEDEEEPDEDE